MIGVRLTGDPGPLPVRAWHRRRWLVALAVAAALGAVLVVGALTVLGPVPVPPDVRELSVQSQALGRALPVQAWVPSGTPDDARLPLVILLHGAGGNEATWFTGRVGDPGLRADLTVFDPATVEDVATFAEPTRPARGIIGVYVGGVATCLDGRPTGARNGKVLRRAA